MAFDVHEVAFEDRSHAIEWIIRNQLGRRNLSDYVKTVLELHLDGVLKKRGLDHMSEKGATGGRGNKKEKGLQNSVNPFDRQKEVAKSAGVVDQSIILIL